MQPCGKAGSGLTQRMSLPNRRHGRRLVSDRWSFSLGLCLALLGSARLVRADRGEASTSGQAAAVSEALDAEGSLLHRRLDLSGVACWNRRSRSWQPLARSPERLLVLNLWSANCAPCRAEFPLLRRMAAAWSKERAVRFLFVADPPHDTEAVEVVEFWTDHAAAVPDADPCRSTTDKLRAALDNQSQPLTLLVDEEGLVRQAFIGTITTRGLASAMERLLKVLSSTPRRLR